MADEQKKEEPRKPPEHQEGPKPPEGQKPPEDKDTTVHAATRLEWKDFMSKEGLDRLQKIQDRKKQIEEEQKKLRDETPGRKNKESWVNNPSSSPVFDPKGKISEGVEEKAPKIKSKLEAVGLTDDTNLNIIKQVLKDVIYEQYTKTGKEESVTKAFADNLDDKVSYLFDELKKLFDSKKHPFATAPELIENFSEFTGTNFFKKGFMQASELKEFTLLEKSSYEAFMTNFNKFHDLGAEKKQLEGEETGLMGKKLEPKELIDQKRITFTKTRVTAPKAPGELDTVLQAEIAKALPPIEDAAIRQKVVDYLAGEVKKLNPQPDEVFELSPDGKWNKVDVAAENQSKDQAKTDAEKQAADTTAAAAESKPFDLKESFKSFGDTIMEIIKWILALFGMKIGAGGVEDLIKEWKDVTPEEKTQLKEFMAEGKKFFSKMDNMNKLIKNQDETRRVLALKKTDTKEGETWAQWIQRHISQHEQGEISNSTTLEAKGIAQMFLSENGPQDPPSVLLQPGQPETQQPKEGNTPQERWNLIRTNLETAPFSADLKIIFDNYIAKKGRPEVKEGLAKAKSKGPVDINAYMEGLGHNYFMDHPEIQKKYESKQMSILDVAEGMFDEIFGFALSEAKTPQEKQKTEGVLSQFKAMLAQILAERGKPGPSPEKQQVTS